MLKKLKPVFFLTTGAFALGLTAYPLVPLCSTARPFVSAAMLYSTQVAVSDDLAAMLRLSSELVIGVPVSCEVRTKPASKRV